MASSRGPHPEDDTLFASSELPVLRAAVRDLSWLRTRGYGDDAAESLVGDRYRLHRRQRNAVARSACTDAEAAHRRVRCRRLEALAGEWVEVDEFNVLITLEGDSAGRISSGDETGPTATSMPCRGPTAPSRTPRERLTRCGPLRAGTRFEDFGGDWTGTSPTWAGSRPCSNGGRPRRVSAGKCVSTTPSIPSFERAIPRSPPATAASSTQSVRGACSRLGGSITGPRTCGTFARRGAARIDPSIPGNGFPRSQFYRVITGGNVKSFVTSVAPFKLIVWRLSPPTFSFPA